MIELILITNTYKNSFSKFDATIDSFNRIHVSHVYTSLMLLRPNPKLLNRIVLFSLYFITSLKSYTKALIQLSASLKKELLGGWYEMKLYCMAK